MFKSLNIIKKLTPLVFILTIGFFITSCDDEVSGCTDSTADNYNPEATVSEDCDYTGCTDPDAENYNAQANIDGDCVYARDKFVGSFLGAFTCTDPLLSPAINSDSLVFSINEGVDDIVENVIFNLVIDGFPIPLRGTVSGDVVTVNDTLEGVMIPDFDTPLGPVTLTADVSGVGSATYTEETKAIEGEINITIAATAPIALTLMDACALIGVKQD